MRTIARTSRFRKDFRRMIKRGANPERLAQIVAKLANDEPLPTSCRPHRLSGDWQGFLECHLAPDWLVIYQVTDSELILIRTGSHSDLFR